MKYLAHFTFQLAVDETVKQVTKAFKEKNNDYFEAVGLVYELWQVE